MHVILFAGSLRKDSCNKKFVREAERVLKTLGATTEYVDLKPLNIPLYDGDDEEASGVPKAVQQLGEKIAKADAVVISNPEYNASISCVTKNTIDWLSRIKPMPVDDKHLLLIGASPGALGAVRGLWHSRQPFEQVGMHVFPQMMALPGAYEAFDDKGQLKDAKLAANLQKMLKKFYDHVSQSANGAAKSNAA